MSAAEKVAAAIDAESGQEILDRVRESEYATEDDIAEFANVLLDGGYREAEEGAFARLFERVLREGGEVIAETVQAAKKRQEKRRTATTRRTAPTKQGDADVDAILDMLFGGELASLFGGAGMFGEESTAGP